MTNPGNLITFAGVDSWSRKLFKTRSGIILVDVDGELHTITDWGEPDWPTGVKTPQEKETYYCIVCQSPIEGEDIEDRHTDVRTGEDCHERCCLECSKEKKNG